MINWGFALNRIIPIPEPMRMRTSIEMTSLIMVVFLSFIFSVANVKYTAVFFYGFFIRACPSVPFPDQLPHSVAGAECTFLDWYTSTDADEPFQYINTHFIKLF